MTPATKRQITRQAFFLGDLLCGQFATEQIKGSFCPGCRLLRLADERDYVAMQKSLKRYQKFLNGRS